MEGLLGTVPRKGGAGREILAGLANALTLLSGLVAVPSLLFQSGMDFTGAYTACMLMSIVGTLLMGRLTGQPLVLAPGIAMAGWLVYGEIISHGIRWQSVLGASFWASVLGCLLMLSPLRKIVAGAVPKPLRRAMIAGLGLMLILQGMIQGRLLVGSPFSVTMLGNLSDPVAYLSLTGIFVTAVLLANGVSGALAVGTLATAAIAWVQGFWVIPSAPFLLPEGMDLVALQMDMEDGASLPGVVLSILLVVLMESLGTLQAMHGAYPERVQASGKALFCLMGAGAAGALLGSLPPRPAPESVAGMTAGGRREWTSYATAFFLFLLLFCAPVLKEMASFGAISVPAMAGAGISLLRPARNFLDGDAADRAASLCLAFLMPLSHDIVVSMGIALLAHVALKAFCGNFSALFSAEGCAAACFGLYFLA